MRYVAAIFCATVTLAACGESPGEAAFDAANARLTTFEEQAAFGNGPVAQQLAERLSTRMKLMRDIGFSKSKGIGPVLTDGQFLTYCQLTDNAVLFLVHVPEFRNFKEDAQSLLLDIAWMSARGITEELREGKDLRLGVGLRGALLYGAVAMGPAASEKPETSANKGVVPADDFYPFFVGAYPQGIELADEEPETPAAAPASAAAAGTPGTATEAPAPGDRVVSYIALLGTDPPSTAIAVAPDLFVASAPLPPRSLSLRLGRLPAIEVTQVGDLPGSDLVLLRPVRPFKVEPIEIAPAVSIGTPATTYFATLEDNIVGTQKFGLNLASLDENIHTDERLAVIPQGGALVDARGRLVGVGTSSANVYAPAVQVQRLIAAFRAANK